VRSPSESDLQSLGAVTDRVTVDRVGHQVVSQVVHSHRPKRINLREISLLKMDHVAIVAREFLTCKTY
jgi:hypothetical protein